MKRKFLSFICVLLLASIALSEAACKAKKPRDCRGRKKTAKTEMGGWL